MSKSKLEDQSWEDQADDLSAAEGESPADDPISGGGEMPPDNPDENQNKEGAPELLTIEEHAGRLHIDKPVFAAVMQCEGWAGGKKVPEAVFKKAVEGFIKAPMGGINHPEGGSA